MFLVYINDLSEVVDSAIRIFADDTFIFDINPDHIGSGPSILQQDLGKITEWAHQWKMSFNPDITKQAVEVLFSNKNKRAIHEHLNFNGIPVKNVDETKHLGMVLDKKLSFHTHISDKIAKANQGIGVMKQLYNYIPRAALETIYKLYVRPHLDYGDVVYHIPDTHSKTFDSENDTIHPLMARLESVQYEAACVISGAWKGTSRKKLYDDLGWESLNHRRNCRRLCLFYEIYKTDFPKYLSKIIDTCKPIKSARLVENQVLANIPCRTLKFSHSFFPSTIKYWNALNEKTKNAKSLNEFKISLLKEIRPKKKEYFDVLEKAGTRYITLIRMGLSPLRRHKFDHKFNDTLDSTCPADDGIENTEHFLLLCKSYIRNRATLMYNVSDIMELNFELLPN